MKYWHELIICLLLGGIPCVWAFHDSGVSGVEAFYESIDASDRTVIYFSILALFHIAASVLWFFAPRWYQPLKVILKNILPVANGVGSSLLCLYRIIAGASIGCVFILVTSFNEQESLRVLGFFAVTALVFLIMSYFINKAFNYANEMQRVGS